MASVTQHATYRGEKMPKPYKNGGWIINDGHYGYLTGYTEDHVIRQWQDAVDESLYRRASEDPERYASHTAPQHGILCCSRCGAVVGDFEAHDRWHARG